jgi:large subunit ribosomal protein L28
VRLDAIIPALPAPARTARVLWCLATGAAPASPSPIFEEFDVAAVCDVCGKGPGFGMSVSHSHRRTHRRWNPNIQTVRTRINGGNRKRLNVCTSCLKAGKVTRG